MDDPAYNISKLQGIICSNYPFWENEVKILYLERRIALLVRQLMRQEQLADNHSRRFNVFLKKYKTNLKSVKQKNDKLKELQKELEAARTDLQAKVERRTKSLEEINQQLLSRARELQESNIALDVLLRKKDNDAKNHAQSCLKQLSIQVMPELEELAGLVEDKKQKILVLRIMNRIQGSASCNGNMSWRTCLSGKEAAVADHIAQGMSHSEAAETLGLSVRTVNTHCYRIRKKLNIPADSKLKDFLMEISRMN